jgi:hypothetical protein
MKLGQIIKSTTVKEEEDPLRMPRRRSSQHSRGTGANHHPNRVHSSISITDRPVVDHSYIQTI